MKNLHIVALIVIGFLFSAQHAAADWTNLGNANGVQVYRDNDTGLEWTATIGQVQSSGWGAPARSLVARYGFRLPSFRELQVMEAHGGFRRLQINTRMQQYYETSNSNVLAAAWGNGFRTPQQRKGVGRNWVIGVRSAQDVNSGGNQGNRGQGGNSQGSTSNQNNNIRMLVIYGTKDEDTVYKNSMRASKQSMSFLINGSGLSVGKEVTIIEGDNATRENILRAVTELSREAGSNGALLVYYLGHGATLTQRGEKIHCIFPLANPEADDFGPPIARESIYRILEQSRIRFAGLITDACSEGGSIPIEAPAPTEDGPEFSAPPITALRALLIYGKGTIDIGSSDPFLHGPEGPEEEPGQMAWYVQDGSLFTIKFIESFSEHFPYTSFRKNVFSELMNKVQSGINQRFAMLIEQGYGNAIVQKSQNIHTFNNTLQ